jgi:biotin carboxylase
MKCRFKEEGIPIPWFTLVESAEHLKEIAFQRDFPLIIKPVDRSGARGVFYLDDGCDLENLFNMSKELSFVGEVMVEEYLPGLQISTETVMYMGKAYTPGFADRNYEKLKTYAPNIIENGGWMPSIATPEERDEVMELVEKAGLALGVTDGVVKGDVVITPDGAKMIEMATRLSGGDFCESLIPLSCDVNIVEAAINIFTGKEPDLDKLEPKFHLGVANRYFFPPAGKLVNIEGVDIVKSQPWIKKFELWYQPGDLLPEIKSHADRFGVFVVTGKDRDEVDLDRGLWSGNLDISGLL